MGGIYARDKGEPEAIWKAIYYHYLPTAVEPSAAPTATSLGEAGVTWAAVALADKLDTLVGLFLAGERPTGSRDPFGLRRQAHGIIRILADAEALVGVRVRTTLGSLVAKAREQFAALASSEQTGPAADGLAEFLFERLHHVFESRGADKRTVRAVLPDAAVALGTPLVDLAENLKALPEFARSEQFRQLATAFKRVRNIGREYSAEAFAADEANGPALETVVEEAAEKALLAEIEQRRGVIEAAVTKGTGYREAYVEASHFEPVVGRFFEEVFVMSDDMRLRQARLRLMKRLETLILRLGDISEIVRTDAGEA
jgi:glycyl-tRNA synthetase beta chain